MKNKEVIVERASSDDCARDETGSKPLHVFTVNHNP